MKKALLCVSFGTASEEARKSIAAVENALQAAAPELMFVRAFTSPTVRRLLAERGESVLSPGEALEMLYGWGVREVVVQPTHILYGREYDGLARELMPWFGKFASLQLGRPLLADTEALRELAQVLALAYPEREGEALVLFGHGSRNFSNLSYAALQTAFRILGRRDVLVGAVEAWPGYEETELQLDGMQVKKVRLAPLMLTAGRAAKAALEGEDSWLIRLKKKGYTVGSTADGLGLLPGVQNLFVRRLKENC